jgi:adenylate cyclase
MEPRVTFAVKPEKEKRSPVRRMPIIFGAAAIIALAFAVGIWQLYVRRPAVEPASADKMAYPLPDKPSIAVLPFDNLSGDPNQEYIADGISENIIATLSNIPELFVIARNSTFTYKGKAVKVQQIAEDLGVRYVLEGSVQKSMDSIRVTVQLIDAIAGHHLWSEKFDRKMESLFQIMDEITHKVVIELQVQLVEGEPARKRYGTNKIDAWAYLVKGFTLFETYQKTNNERARELFEQALKIDPEYAYAWVMLSWTYYIEVRQGYSRFPPESIKQSIQFAQRAKAIDDTLSDIYALLGSIYLIQRQHDKAIAEGQKSIQLGPNNASNHILLAQIMFYAGKTKEAVALAEKAIRLNPYCPNWYFGILILCYRQAERYEEAIDIAEALLDQGQKDGGNLLLPHLQLAAIYSMMGQYEKARKHWEEVLLINPNFTSEYLRKTAFFKDPAKVEHVLEALRKAGLK